MTPYTKLKFHLERHAYKKGRFKGDAPADQDRRGKNHFRVAKQGDTMCVRLYNTNLIEVTPDDNVRISMGGWWTSTTKQNINEAMWHFLGWGGVHSRKVFSYNQTCIRVHGKDYKFYDGMEFDAAGKLLSPPSFFERKRTDREQTAEFRADVEASGFKEVWPVLFATAESTRGQPWYGVTLSKLISREEHANQWADLAAWMKYQHDDHKAAYQALLRQCTRDMTEIVATDVTVL